MVQDHDARERKKKKVIKQREGGKGVISYNDTTPSAMRNHEMLLEMEVTEMLLERCYWI